MNPTRLFISLLICAALLTGCAGLPFLPQPEVHRTTPTGPASLSTQPTATPLPATLPPTPPPPTATPVPPTPTPLPPTATPFPFEVQLGAPRSMPAFNHPEPACGWAGIAGQVFDSQGNPLTNVLVVVEGTLNGQPFNGQSLSGVAPAYGPGGYEIQIGPAPVASEGTLKIQVLDLNWSPVSAPLTLTTHASCDDALLLVNFQATGVLKSIFLPAVSSGNP